MLNGLGSGGLPWRRIRLTRITKSVAQNSASNVR
jgi:hypothetical protein